MLCRRVTVARKAVYVNGHIEVGTPKMHDRRTVPFPKFLTEPIARAREEKPRSALVFSDKGGGYLLTPTMRENSWWDKVLLEAHIPPITIHDLRHTAASLAISAGTNVKAVQRMLGHVSAAMTLDTYADLFEDDLDAVVERLDVEGSQNVGKMWANLP